MASYNLKTVLKMMGQNILNWVKSNCVNNLLSTATNLPLAAAQGKVLDEKIGQINQSLNSIVFKPIATTTSSGGDSFLLELDDAITSSAPLLVQFQSNSSNAQVKKYYITTPGKVRVILTESIAPGTWKFNVAYIK